MPRGLARSGPAASRLQGRRPALCRRCTPPGLDACAALTSTTHGMALPDLLAASDLFNHCIVRLRLKGTSYWLDPTCPEQTGRLTKLSQVRFGWALPLSGDDDTLEQIGSGAPGAAGQRRGRGRVRAQARLAGEADKAGRVLFLGGR